ncbi:MAG: TPM domain-containing protein [Pseudomonadota bacterium]
MYRLLAFAVVALFVLVQAPAMAGPYPDYRNGYLNDFVEILGAEDASAVEQMLRGVRAEHGIEMTVAIIASRQNFDPANSLEAFATRMFNGWGIGDPERNDGVLFLVVTDDREMRLELGAGYADAWDRQAEQIVQNIMVPNFRDGKMAQGIKAGVGTMIARIRNNVSQGKAPTDSPFNDGTAVGADAPKDKGGGWLGWILAVLGVPIAAGGAWVARRYVRYKPRSCTRCSTRMALRDEGSDDAYLDAGARREEQLGSVDHDVWSCPACGHVRIEAWRNWFSRYGECPACEHRTRHTVSTVLSSASTISMGVRELRHSCLHCGHAYTETKVIPKKSRSRSSSGGSSFGGGSSSGGGASGRW